MAVTVIKNPSGLKMKFDCGKDENGKAIRKTRTYSNLRAGALVQDYINLKNKGFDYVLYRLKKLT